jgi:VanZ family protein
VIAADGAWRPTGDPGDTPRLTSDPAHTGRRLGALLLGYLLTVVGVIVLSPFRFAVPAAWTAHWAVLERGWPADLLLNVVLFLPLGFLGRRIPGLDGGRPGRWLVLGGGCSLAIEAAQLFLAGRYPTATDILANAAGAWLGAWLSDRAVGGLGGGDAAVQRLLLDVPLIGIPYLLVPILWLDGLGMPRDGAGAWVQLPLAAAGGLALAGAARTAEASDRPVRRALLGFVAGWWLVAAAPTWGSAPRLVPLGLGVALLAAVLGDPFWRRLRARNLRLEPIVVAPVLLLVLAHVAGGGSAMVGLPFGEGAEPDRRTLLRWIQVVSVCTLVGYLLAEWRGRRQAPLGRAVVPPMLLGAGLGALLGGGEWLHWLPAAVAAGVGATLYALHRDHVVALRSAGRGIPTRR